MSRIKDLTKQKFGKLKVIELFGFTKSNKAVWLCLCDCGNETTVVGSHLINGNTKSCGCYKMEVARSKKSYKRKTNTYDLSGKYGIGFTTKDEEFYFDLEDYNKIKNYCWRIHRGYVETSVTNNGVKTTIYLHRLIFPDINFNIHEPDHKN